MPSGVQRKPSAISFSLPSQQYFQGHNLPPVGIIIRKRPPESANLYGLAVGLALRISVSVSATSSLHRQSGGIFSTPSGLYPQIYPRQDPAARFCCGLTMTMPESGMRSGSQKSSNRWRPVFQQLPWTHCGFQSGPTAPIV